MAPHTHAALREDPLSLDAAQQFVSHPGAGAVVVFTGTVREHAEGKAVSGLTYEAYAQEAQRRLDALCDELVAREGVVAVWVEHRVGALAVRDPSVVVAVSAAHRPEAFSACREGIDRLKAEVPIWKQEHWQEGGAHWPGTT